MAYGKIKADTFVYDNSGSDVEVTLSSLGNKVNANNPTLTGTVTIPTPAANDNTTKAASTAYVQTELGDYAVLAGPALTGTTTAVNLTLSGNLQVNGTTTTVASSTMTVTDKNIEIAKGAANDAAADGAGITVDSGDGDKTWNWVDATDAWTSSEHIHLIDNKKLLVGTGSDLEIFHNGSHSLINDAGTGNIRLQVGGTTQFEVASTGVTVTGSVTDDKGDVRKIPFDSNTGQTTLTTAMVGKVVSSNTGWTIPASTFAAGDAITLVNNNAATKTITATALTALYNGTDGANVKASTLTLGVRSMATIWFETHDHCYIQASALTVS